MHGLLTEPDSAGNKLEESILIHSVPDMIKEERSSSEEESREA